MDDLTREKEKGFSYWYMKDVPVLRRFINHGFNTPGFGLAAQLFASLSRQVLDECGTADGEQIVRKAVEFFGRERGKRIAAAVSSLGKPLTLKNWLIYSDIDGSNFEAKPYIENHDLLVEVRRCSFMEAADAWGLRDQAKLYCRYVDYAILNGYNPDIKLQLISRHDSGKDFCLFRYIMKEANK